MDVLQGFTYALVAVAASLYIREELTKMVARSMNQRMKRIFERHEKDMKKHFDDAETSVELWWSETGKERVMQHFAEEMDTEEMGPLGEMMQGLYAQVHLQEARGNAHALAAHLLSGETNERLFRELAKIKADGAAEQITEMREKLAQHEDEHRTALLEVGIDLEAFEAYFAPSTPAS